MRLVLACVLIAILAKLVQTQRECSLIAGDLYMNNTKSRHVICNESTNDRYFECEYSFVEVLKIQNCPVESIESEFIEYQNVHTLDISFSNYSTQRYFHLNFEYLDRLNVSHNKLTEIPEHLFNNTKRLTEVNFSHNQISKLNKLTFSKVPKLKTVNISHNQIEAIDSGLFSELPDLEILDLSDNKIKEIPEISFVENSKLKTLNLKNNPIQRLDCGITQLLNGMTSINVSFKDVTHFDLSCANHLEWTANEEEIIFKNGKDNNELRYPKKNFKNLHQLSIRGNRLQNALDIVNMLGESTEWLDLSENHLGKLNETSFHGLNNLELLYLRETNLSFAESLNPFEHLDNLMNLDISYNNLTTLNITLFAKTLKNLWNFRAAGNQFVNGLEVIQSLGLDLLALDLSQNFVGILNRSTFQHFEQLDHLNLSDTHLEHFYVEIPMNVVTLDISRNRLKRLNVTLLSDTLNRLRSFYAADNNFENIAEIIQNLGSNLRQLVLSGNYMGKMNETTFEHLEFLRSLSLRRTNSSILNTKPFEALRIWLEYLDISNNKLKKFNFFTSYTFMSLNRINLSENHLTQLDGLTKHSYPKLIKLDITNNKLNCTYLSMFRKEWKELEIIGDQCDQFENIEIQNQTEINVENTSVKITTESNIIITIVQTETDKEAKTEFVIAPETSAPSSASVVWYTVPVGVSILVIVVIIVVVVVFLRRKSSLEKSKQKRFYYRLMSITKNNNQNKKT